MNNKSKLYVFLLAIVAAVTLTSCDELFNMEYKIVGSWQVAHTYLNGEAVDSCEYIGYSPGTYYYLYADHVMSVRTYYNGEYRESTFGTYILDQKAKTLEINYSIYGRRYHFIADIDRLTKKDLFIEFTDQYGDHWRLEMFTRSN